MASVNKTSAVLIFLAAFGVYLWTLHPTISPYRDSGDLIVASYTVGVAHPPGYPLYALSGKIFSEMIPWGNVAYRLNIMSAVFGAAAAAFAALAVLELAGPNLWAALAALLLAFSPAFWRLSQVSEMYSLNAAFTALLFWLCAAFYRMPAGEKAENRLVFLYLLAFTGGIATGNHPTVYFLFAHPVLAWMLWRSKFYSLKDYFFAGLFFLAGFSVYLFLPVRSSTNPLSDWGHPAALENFFRVITRADYGGFKLHPEESKFEWTFGVILGHFWVYLKSLGEQFTWAGAALGLWGMWLKRKDRFYRFVFWTLMLAGPGFIILSNLPPSERTTLPILEPHLIMPGVLFIFYVAAALEKISAYAWGKGAAAVLLAGAFALHLPLCQYRSSFYAYDYGRALLASVAPGGMIYNPDDSTAFITAYNQAVLGKRPDASVIAFFRTRWGYDQLRARHPELLPRREIRSGQELALVLLDFNRDKRPVYAELPSKFPQGYSSRPEGLMHRLADKNPAPLSDRMFLFYPMRGEYRVPEDDFFTGQVISYYAWAYNNLGIALAGEKRYKEARLQYERALAIDPGLEPAKNNMGTLAFMTGDYAGAERWFTEILKDNPGQPNAQYNLELTRQKMVK